ncbi:MAG: DUF1587 domain-containing protein, partial [Planctomycetota bacterium]
MTLLVAMTVSCWGDDAGPAKSSAFTTMVQPFFQDYCVHCHDEDTTQGGLNLVDLRDDFQSGVSAQHWVEVMDRINLGEMPPEEEARPPSDETAAVLDWIAGRVAAIRAKREGTNGRVLLRRMTRREYAATVEDLLHVRFDGGDGPLDVLPPDGSIGGFDRNAKSLLIDPSLLDAYLRVGKIVAQRAVRFRPPVIQQRTIEFQFEDTVRSAMSYKLAEPLTTLDATGKWLILLGDEARTFSVLRHPYSDTEIPISGRYRVRVRAAADPGNGSDGAPQAVVYMSLSQGPGDPFASVRVDATLDNPQIYEFEIQRDRMFQGEYQIRLEDAKPISRYSRFRGKRRREADELSRAGQTAVAAMLRGRIRAEGDGDIGGNGQLLIDEMRRLTAGDQPGGTRPKLFLDWIQVVGPLQDSYPPHSMTTLFPKGWGPKHQTLQDARDTFRQLLPRAYRRPVTQSELEEIVSIVAADLEAGNRYEIAMQSGIVA